MLEAALPAYEQVPDYHRNSPESAALIDALTNASLRAAEALDETARQFNIRTATWGLSEWERLVGIQSDSRLDFAQRRSAVVSRMLAAGTATVEAIRQVAVAITGWSVTVQEDAAHYTFHIYFSDKSSRFAKIPAEELLAAIEELKPAHLMCVLSPICWGDLEAERLTWQQMEETFPRWADFEGTFYVHGEGV